MNNLAAIPPHVLRDVVEFVEENNLIRKNFGKSDIMLSSKDFVEQHMSAFEILDAYLSWNGIIGYSAQILDAVHSIDKACK